MIKACVIGMPIAHSRSPLIHGYWLKRFGIDGSYERILVEPQDLGSFLENLDHKGYAGCNITIPHKETAARLVKHPDARARMIGSINTVFIRNHELHATSTDGMGFCDNVQSTIRGFSWNQKKLVILGAGGSSLAIIDEVLRRGAQHIAVCNRTLDRARNIADRFQTRVTAHHFADAENHFKDCDLVVNATSLGLSGKDPLKVNLEKLSPEAIVADINYVPLKTDFIRSAEERNLKTVGGLGMLLHQAVTGFELWFGRKPEVTPELYELVARDIDPDFRT